MVAKSQGDKSAPQSFCIFQTCLALKRAFQPGTRYDFKTFSRGKGLSLVPSAPRGRHFAIRTLGYKRAFGARKALHKRHVWKTLSLHVTLLPMDFWTHPRFLKLAWPPLQILVVKKNLKSRWKLCLTFRKILVSVKYLSATPGPEMAAPILWTPGRNASVRSAGKTMSIKFLVLGGGGILGFGGGGGSADFIFMGARIFLRNCGCQAVKKVPVKNF